MYPPGVAGSTDGPTVLVGGGAAAVSTARVLVERGVPFTWFAGQAPPTAFNHRFETMSAFRRQERDLWPTLLGENVSIAELLQPSSPKNRVRRFREDVHGYEEATKLDTADFFLRGTLALGGLTNFWGAEVHVFDESDMAMPAEAWRELRRSYTRVAAAMPITGVADPGGVSSELGALISQPPLPLPKTAQHILKHASAHGDADSIRLRQSCLAIRTAPSAQGGHCSYCNGCLWGCKEGAIYSAAHEVERIARERLVIFAPGAIVDDIERTDSGFALAVRSCADGTAQRVNAKRVFLAAGAPVSTRLALGCAGRYEEWIGFGHTCGFVFPVVIPRLLGSLPPEAGYSFAQVSWEFDDRHTGERITGSFYSPTALPDSELVRFLPFTRPGAINLWRNLRGAMLIGNGFLPSDHSATRVRLRRSDGALEFRLDAAPSSNGEAAARAVRRLTRHLLKRGAIVLPFSVKMADPGADFHYGASLPHGGSGPLATDLLGQLPGLPGLHIVDGSVLPRLPSRHPTFTIMANADRISRAACEA